MTELALTPQVFAILSALIEERTGMHYGPDDRALLADKLMPRVAERGLESLLDYYYYLRYDPGADAELPHLVDSLVVNETYFFREVSALELAVNTFVPELVRSGVRPRLWCAACATGEEPLTIAMLLDQAALLDKVTLVASDISRRALARAREGTYFRRSLRALPPDVLGRWLIPQGDGVRVEQRLLDAVDFRRVNLIDEKQVSDLGSFDLVFCRNVLIYFSDARVANVIAALWKALSPGGRLFVGTSESLLRFDSAFLCEERAGTFFYRKRSE
jgi:chemotaxis protein methyltransferase CheR